MGLVTQTDTENRSRSVTVIGQKVEVFRGECRKDFCSDLCPTVRSWI
jgi:hypothetical protein